MTTPSNPYYQETFTAQVGSQARSRAMDAEFRSIQRGFDLLKLSLGDIEVSQVNRFIELLDCPDSYNGSALKLVRVNSATTGLEFAAPGNLIIKVVSGTTYTPIASDAGKLLLFTNASAVTVTVPPDVFAQGDIVYCRQAGGGKVTFQAGVDLTLNSSGDLLSTRTQHAQVALVFDDVDTACLVGERDASITGFAVLVGGNDFTGSQSVKFTTLTDATSIATDAAASNHFLVTLGGNRTLANPTNLRDGVILNWWVKQDATGGRTLAYGSMFKWPGGDTPTVTATANGMDLIVAQYHASLGILACCITQDFR